MFVGSGLGDRLEFFAFRWSGLWDRLEVARFACEGGGRRARRRLRRVCVQSRALGSGTALDTLGLQGLVLAPQAVNARISNSTSRPGPGAVCSELQKVQKNQRGDARNAFGCSVLLGLGEASPARFLDSLHQHYTYRAGRGPIRRAQKNSVSAALFGMRGAARSSSAAARRRRPQRAETSTRSAAATTTMQTPPTG